MYLMYLMHANAKIIKIMEILYIIIFIKNALCNFKVTGLEKNVNNDNFITAIY